MEVDTNNIESILNHITDKVKDYYNNYDIYGLDMEKLVEFNSKLASLSWYVAREEAIAETQYEKTKGELYLSNKDNKTIPETQAIVKIETSGLRLKYKKINNSMKAITNILTQISIRIKYLREENING